MPTHPELVPVDPLGLAFTGTDHKALAEALAAAFPSPDALDEMLTFRLNQPLSGITAPYPLTHATFEVVRFYKAKGHLLRLMANARASQPDNASLSAVGGRFCIGVQTPSQPQLEKLVKKTSVPFAVAVWRERLGKREVCVCRVEVPTSAGTAYGTGFLVGPDLVLTNHHVVAPAIPGAMPAAPAAAAADIVLRFDYKELDKMPINPGVEVKLAVDWLVDSSPHSHADLENPPKATTPTLEELDYALLRLAEPIGDRPIPLGNDVDPQAKKRGWIELRQTAWPFATESTLLIIQHPNGAPLSLAMDFEAKMQVNGNDTRVIYQTGTEPGSSGSPCFNQFWDLVALHHAGDPLYPDLAPGAYNEGIPIYRIVERLKRQAKADELTLI